MEVVSLLGTTMRLKMGVELVRIFDVRGNVPDAFLALCVVRIFIRAFELFHLGACAFYLRVDITVDFLDSIQPGIVGHHTTSPIAVALQTCLTVASIVPGASPAM